MLHIIIGISVIQQVQEVQEIEINEEMCQNKNLTRGDSLKCAVLKRGGTGCIPTRRFYKILFFSSQSLAHRLGCRFQHKYFLKYSLQFCIIKSKLIMLNKNSLAEILRS